MSSSQAEAVIEPVVAARASAVEFRRYAIPASTAPLNHITIAGPAGAQAALVQVPKIKQLLARLDAELFRIPQ